jgi:hypothetical protein
VIRPRITTKADNDTLARAILAGTVVFVRRRALLRYSLIFAAASVIAGCTFADKGISVTAADPSVSITQPSNGSEHAEGVEIQFVARILPGHKSDAAEDMLHRWVAGDVVMCEEQQATADGDAICLFAFTNVGEQTVTVNVTSPSQTTGSATIDLDITSNAAPTIAVVQPQDQSTYPSTDTIKFEAIVDDLEDPLDQLLIEVTYDGTVIDFDDDHAESDGRFVGYSTLPGGQHVVEFKVTDLLGKTAKESVLVSVNSPPSEPKIKINPDPARAGDALTAKIKTDAIDPDGDTINYEYEWFVDGQPWSSSSQQTKQMPDPTAKDQVWTVEVTAVDGYNRGVPGVDDIVIENTAPTLSGCTISPNSPKNDDDLAAVWSGFSDPDGDPPEVNYRWMKKDSSGTWQYTGISSEIFPYSETTRGDEIKVECTPFDGEDTGTPLESPIEVVENAAPEMSSCDIYPVNPNALDELVATPDNLYDDDGDNVDVSYVWYLEGVVQPTVTGNTFPQLLAERDDTVRVECTPNDGTEDGTSIEGSTLIVNSPPVAPIVAWDDDEPVTSDALTVLIETAAWDPDDGDPVDYTYEWFVDGVVVPASSKQTTITAGQTMFQEFWEVHVTASDFQDDATPVIITVTIGNKAPELDTCQIGPYFPGIDDDLEVTATGFTDEENHPEDYKFEWFSYNHGTSQWDAIGVTGDTLPKSNTALDDEVKVTCYPWDGFDQGTGVDSITVRIGNSAPAMTDCAIGPSSPNTETDLVATASGFSDADDDPEGYTFKWYRNTAQIPTVQGEMLLASDTHKLDEIYVECYPNDGFATGTPVQSNTLVIQNTRPEPPTIDLLPSDAVTFDQLTAHVLLQGSDVDSDSITYNYYWYVNGVEYAGFAPYPTAEQSIPADIIEQHEQWTVDVASYDGIEESDLASATVTVGNYLPYIDACNVTPHLPTTVDDLVANPQNWFDKDGDPEQYTFKWYKQSGSTWVEAGGTDQTYPKEFTTADDVYKVECTPTNGPNEEGVPVESTPGKLIENSEPTITNCEIVPEFPTTDQSLFAVASGWDDADGDEEEYTYKWYVNNALDSTEKSSLFPPSKTLRDYDIRVECFPKDDDGKGPKHKSATITVVNSPPTAPVVSFDPDSEAPAGDRIDLIIDSPSTDPDGDTILYYNYYWEVDSHGFANPTYPSTKDSVNAGVTKRDENWKVEVRAWDGAEEGPGAIVDLDVVNAAPTLSLVALTPTTPDTTDDITAIPLGWYDGDADSERYRFVWYINDGSGWVIDAAETATCVWPTTGNCGTYPSAKTYRDLQVRVRVYPDDGEVINGEGDYVESADITIRNSKPTPPDIEIGPFPPGALDDLHCNTLVAATDADPGDMPLDIVYSWYSPTNSNFYDHTDLGGTGQDLISGLTGDGQGSAWGWECTAHVSDGIDTVQVTSPTVYIQDLDDPSPPQFADMPEFQNDDTWIVSGTCEVECGLTFFCSDDDESWDFGWDWDDMGGSSADTQCNGAGTFTTDVTANSGPLDRGEVTSCFAICEDWARNTSGFSDTVHTEVCDPYDELEVDYPNAGDSGPTAHDLWVTLNDSNSTSLDISGNILEGDEEDWFIINTSDDQAADQSAGRDGYNLRMDLTGSGAYTFMVFRDGYTNNDAECPVYLVDGYSEYNDRVVDDGLADHPTPGDAQACKDNHQDYNECEDLGASYWVKIMRDPDQPYECDSYTLTVSNGGTVFN